MSSSRHKSKRKSSRAATSCSHTSKRAKSPRTTPRKRRKSHNATTPDDNLFAIKDIIDEKILDGKRYYQIDWADNPTTGESYSPTWEPEENANEEAVEDWKWEQQRRALLGLDSVLIREQGLSDELTSRQTPPADIFVELPSKSEFLRSRPDFNPTEVITISASQLSQFPPPGSETELPPAQFCITSSHPSQGFIGDSQPRQSIVAESQDVTGKPHISQRTTIPDSQDFSTEFTQDSIPSRQPGIVLGSFRTISFSTYRNLEGDHPEGGDPKEETPREVIQQRGYPEKEHSVSNRATSSFEGFLTQVDFGVGDFALSGDTESRPQSDDVDLPQRGEQFATLVGESSLEDSQQPAQRVLPLPGQGSIFQTQNEEDFFSASEGYDFVPATSQRDLGRSQKS